MALGELRLALLFGRMALLLVERALSENDKMRENTVSHRSKINTARAQNCPKFRFLETKLTVSPLL